MSYRLRRALLATLITLRPVIVIAWFLIILTIVAFINN